MSTVRVNITLPEDLARKLDSLVEPKKKSRFVAEAVEKKIEAIAKARAKAKAKDKKKATGKGTGTKKDPDDVFV